MTGSKLGNGLPCVHEKSTLQIHALGKERKVCYFSYTAPVVIHRLWSQSQPMFRYKGMRDFSLHDMWRRLVGNRISWCAQHTQHVCFLDGSMNSRS